MEQRYWILNDNLQVLPNNEYYQNFSYSISSRVPLDTWEDTVSSINHPSGFRKFSDLQVESYIEDHRYNPFGIDSEVDIVVDVISESNIHCFHDFDDVSERTSIINNSNVSREIHLKTRSLRITLNLLVILLLSLMTSVVTLTVKPEKISSLTLKL